MSSAARIARKHTFSDDSDVGEWWAAEADGAFYARMIARGHDGAAALAALDEARGACVEDHDGPIFEHRAAVAQGAI